MKRTLILALLAASFPAGCSMTPDYTQPEVSAPAAFSSGTAQATPIHQDWWANFGSVELDMLMDQAIARNNDIQAGIYRVQQARANLKIAGADLMPAVDGSAGAGRIFSRHPNSARSSVDAGIEINYELDLFGGNRANAEAARANLAGTQYGQDALNLVVMGDVARSYFTLLHLRERLKIADDNLANAREVLRIIQARFDAGSVSALDLSQQKSSVANSEASRASLVQSAANAENALAVLVGQAPTTLQVAGNSLTSMTIPNIAPGQPSALLQRRPDIRAAEADLVAANANIGAARAALFPSVNLGSGLSTAAAGFGNPATTAMALAASLAVPIFNGGRLEGGVENATARQKERAEIYRKTVLVSFQETEDALAAVKASESRERSFALALTEARKAYDLSRQQYDAGAIDFQTLLDTQNALLNAQDGYAQTRLERLSAAIDLYKALGGGWNAS